MAPTTAVQRGNQPSSPTFGTLLRGFVVLLILPAVIFTAVLLYTKYETVRTTAPPPGQPGALVWNDGGVIFSNTNEIAAWVRLHGSNFQAFKRNHPAAVQLVKSRAKASVQTTHQKLAAGKSTPVAVEPTQVVASTSSRNWIGLILIGAAGILLVLVAFAPFPLLRRLHLTAGPNVGDVRLISIAGAAAIFAGLALALLL